jgi:fibronectin-binding autotransporter adhesin
VSATAAAVVLCAAKAIGRTTVSDDRQPRVILVAMIVAAAALVAGAARAQTLTWGATGGGGTGPWDTSTANWFDGSGPVLWTQGSSAIFGGTAGTVTLSVPITAQDLTFDTSGYTITGSTLTIGVGSTPTISLKPATSSIINSIVAGSNGLLVTGGGALTLGGANTFTGAVNIATGTVVLGNNAALGSSAAGTTIAAGATLDLNGKNIGSEPIILQGGIISNSSASDGVLGSVQVNADSFLTPNSGFILLQNTSGAGSLTLSSNSGKGIFDNVVGGTWSHTGGTVLNSGFLDFYEGTTITGGPITINGGTFRTFGASGGRIGADVAVTINGGVLQVNEGRKQSAPWLALAAR